MTSLKTFHVVFLICSVLITLGFSVWSFQEYRLMNETSMMLYSGFSALSGFVLLIYGFWFLKKINTSGGGL
jgi:hypothetical protein